MTDRPDPRIMALMVELAESSHSAPSFGELEEIVEQTGHVPAPRPPEGTLARRGSQWLAGLAAAVVVLLLVGGVVWLLSPDATVSPIITQPPTTSITQPPAPSVTEPPAPNGSGGWMWIEDVDAFPQRDGAQSPVINSVDLGGPGLVAVGFDSSPSSSSQTQGTAPTTVPAGTPGEAAAVWVSADGMDWTRVPHDEAVFGGPGDQSMTDVVAGGPGLVAVGEGFGAGLVWTSSDGFTWSRVYEEPGVSISAVTAGGPGLVAVGAGESGAAVWTSTDGVTWSRVPEAGDVFRGAGMNDVTVGPEGLVAVGSADQGGAAAVWTSVDGISWAVAYSQEGPEMRAVSKGGPGLVAVGWNGSVWTSPDGITWTRQSTDEQTFAGASHRLQAIATVGESGVVVVAQSGFPGPSAVWTSDDGVTWERIDEDVFLALQTDARINDVTISDRGVVVVGSLGEDADPGPAARPRQSAAVWVMFEGG